MFTMKKYWQIPVIIFLALYLATPLYAVKSRSSTHKTKGQFERGTLTDISILYKGIITPAPHKQKLLDAGYPYVWSIVTDTKNNIFIGTGNDGIIYKISTKGDTSVFFDSDELEVFALSIDTQDNIYAATSPNGKVFKISPNGTSAVFFDPEDKYIWALTFDELNNLYVGTGSAACIYKVTPDGKSTILLQSEQTHIRCLYFQKNTLFAGSSGNGYVYQLGKDVKPVVLYDTQMQEVDEIVVTTDGTVYAAAFGEPQMKAQERKNKTAKAEDDQAVEDSEEALEGQSFILESIAQVAQTPTSLFKIDKNGYSHDLWRGSEDRIQSLALHQDGDVLLGTGDEGKLYKINADGEASLLLKFQESQITAINPVKNGQYIIGTSNLGSVYTIDPQTVPSASFESETIDAGLPATWGTLTWEGQKNAGQLDFYTRTGNTEKPEQSWNPWTKATGDDNVLQIASPAARFIQWRCEFKSDKKNPMLEMVTISYLQKNLPPEISDIIVHRPGDYYVDTQSADQQDKGIPYPQNPPKAEYKQGYRSIDWMFEDPNFDGVLFDLYYKSLGQKSWKLLKKTLANSYYSWDSQQMADGEYEVKIIGYDSPTNPDNLALSGEEICDKFIIDNSGPEITGLQPGAGKLRFQVRDKWNTIKNVYYSVNAGDWKSVFPVDGMNDTKLESFDINVSETGNCEISIKAEDSIENTSVIHYEYNQQ